MILKRKPEEKAGGDCPSTPCSDSSERCYTTRSSAHGSGYVPLSNPERFEMTLAEAEADVIKWRSFADTVGGDAIVVRDPNAGSDAPGAVEKS